MAAAGTGAEVGYVATQDDRSTSEVLSDQLLVSKIKAKLIATPGVPAFDINVDSFKGIITLRGALTTQESIDKALDVVKETDGVHGVESKLVLVP